MILIARRLALSLAFMLAACGPSPGDMTATMSSTTADPTTTSTSTTTGTTGTPTTGGSASTSTSTSTTGTTGTGTTGTASVCDPQPDDVFAHVVIDDTEFPGDPLDFTEHCTVDAITTDESLVIALSGCKVDPDDPVEDPVTHTIAVTATPDVPLDLAVGEPVVFSQFVEAPWWYNQAFALRRPTDELVLAGLEVSEMPGESLGPPLDFFAPLTITIEQVCEPEPLGPPPESGFIAPDDCVQVRREQLRFAWQDGAVLELIDRSTALWPDQPYRIIVGAAEALLNLGGCADVPNRFVRAMILRHQQ